MTKTIQKLYENETGLLPPLYLSFSLCVLPIDKSSLVDLAHEMECRPKTKGASTEGSFHGCLLGSLRYTDIFTTGFAPPPSSMQPQVWKRFKAPEKGQRRRWELKKKIDNKPLAELKKVNDETTQGFDLILNHNFLFRFFQRLFFSIFIDK